MVVTSLRSELLPILPEAVEIWIAVALMKETGFAAIQECVPEGVVQHHLIGVDLPTMPAVLRSAQARLQPGRFEARLAKYREDFHAKVYIIKTHEKLQAFVGSANLTDGGLAGNHEMSYLVTDQHHCQQLIAWFNELFALAYPLNEHNLQEYEQNYVPPDGESRTRHRRRALQFTRPSPEEMLFENFDLSHHFFQKEDYLAFRESLQADRSPAADRERKSVWEKFFELHQILFPMFSSYGIARLDHHRRIENIVSRYKHADGYTSRYLQAMWLSYGKSKEEIKRYQDVYTPVNNRRGRYRESERDSERDKQSFINHARLQIRIECASIGIWILFAKNNGSLFDRDHFRREMMRSNYRSSFYEELRRLPDPYWIRVNREQQYVSFFENPEVLHSFCKADTPQEYFIIGRDYSIDDGLLRSDSLPGTVLKEFQRLMPLYEMMRHRIE